MECAHILLATSLILHVFHKFDAELNVIPRDTEVMINETTYMNCSTSLDAEKVQWRHGNNYVYAGRSILEPYNVRFSVEINSSTGTNNLVIRSVQPSDAGQYECFEDEGSGERRSAQLIVLDDDPVCKSNMHSRGVIGPNNCDIEPDKIEFSCSVTYYGNIFPVLQWKASGDNQSIIDGAVNFTSKKNDVTYTLTMKSTLDLNNSSFICQTTRSSKRNYSCLSAVIKILYIFRSNITVQMTMYDEVTCIANTSQSCNYKWKWYSGYEWIALSNDQTLKPSKVGWHRCEATCLLGNKSCTVEPMYVEVHSTLTTSGQIVLSLLVLSAVVLLGGVVIYLWRQTRNDEENMTNVRHLLLQKIDPDSGLIDKLLPLGALTYPETENIKSGKEILDRNEKILELIIREKRHQTLMTALTDTGQQHLVNFVRGNGVHRPEYGAVWPLRERETNILNVNRLNLIQLLDPCDLITRMSSNSVLNDRQQKYINSLPNDTEKSEALLDILRRGSEENYRKTVECLRESKQEQVADILENRGALVQVDVSNEGNPEQVNAEEDRIVEALANILRNTTLPQYLRIREHLDLRIMHAKKGQSIVFFIYCKTLEELLYLHELLTKGEFRQKIAIVFDLLITRRETRVSTVNWSEEEFTKAKTYFEKISNLFEEQESEPEEKRKPEQKWRKLIGSQIDEHPTIRRRFPGSNKQTPSTSEESESNPEKERKPEQKWRKLFGSQGDEHPTIRRRFPDKLPSAYESNPVLLQTIKIKVSEDRGISGMTILDKELFVASGKSSEVEVYDSLKFSFSRLWNLKELIEPSDIGSCNRNKCLYILDNKGDDQSKEILRVDAHGKLIKKWSTGDDWGRSLSVTDESNVILAVLHKHKLNEYSSDGQLIREIILSDAGFLYPLHAIKLASGHFLVSYGEHVDSLHTVCLMDADGKLKKSFGGKPGSTNREMNDPEYLAIDGNGFVMVADTGNRRVLLLGSDLEFKREILSKEKHELQKPERIVVDQTNNRLFVADNEWDSKNHTYIDGRILIFEFKLLSEI